MKNAYSILSATAAAVILATAPVAAQEGNAQSVAYNVDAKIFEGDMLYGAGGRRLGAVYSVTPEGAPQIILNGKLYTIPASSLSLEDGKLHTSMSKKEIVV